MSLTAEDAHFMARALRLAQRGLYSTRPNPAVGCVLVYSGRIVGEGWHKKAGGPHAEVLALRQAGAQAQGATAYVTLEPCSHWGRTPPCAQSLVDAGVARVVVAMVDPNPQVQGQGIAWLRRHGIQVDIGLMADEARQLNAGFVKAMTEGLPYVRLKLATSLDGKVAAADGSSQWISAEAARYQGHLLRARSGAVVTGIGTVLADDPLLNVRLPEEKCEALGLDEALCHPLRVVLDSRLSMPQTASMLQLPGTTLIATSEQALTENKATVNALRTLGAEVVAFSQQKGEPIDLRSLLHHLTTEYAVRDVLLEAGPRLSGAAMAYDVVDEVHWFQADCVLGDEGLDVLHLPAVRTLSDKLCWQRIQQRRVGQDSWHILQRGR